LSNDPAQVSKRTAERTTIFKRDCIMVYPPDQIAAAAGEKYLKVCQGNDLAAEIFICFESDGRVLLKEFIGPRGPNSLGPRKIRAIFRLLHQAFPSVETVGGFRSTGVRWNRPENLESSLSRIVGSANAMREAA
jgi:hypothetical protein